MAAASAILRQCPTAFCSVQPRTGDSFGGEVTQSWNRSAYRSGEVGVRSSSCDTGAASPPGSAGPVSSVSLAFSLAGAERAQLYRWLASAWSPFTLIIAGARATSRGAASGADRGPRCPSPPTNQRPLDKKLKEILAEKKALARRSRAGAAQPRLPYHAARWDRQAGTGRAFAPATGETPDVSGRGLTALRRAGRPTCLPDCWDASWSCSPPPGSATQRPSPARPRSRFRPPGATGKEWQSSYASPRVS